MLVSPKVSLAPSALPHCCLPEQRRWSLPGEQPSHHLRSQGCYALRRLGDIPGAAGDVRLGLPLQAISFCIHIAAEGQGSPLAGEAAHNQGSIPLLWPRFLISSPQASAADRCQTRGNPATLFPTGPSKPLEMLLLFMKIGSGSCCQLLPELQRHPCHRGSYRKTLRNGTAGTR